MIVFYDCFIVFFYRLIILSKASKDLAIKVSFQLRFMIFLFAGKSAGIKHRGSRRVGEGKKFPSSDMIETISIIFAIDYI